MATNDEEPFERLNRPGFSGDSTGSGVFVDVSASHGISVGFFDTFAARVGVAAPGQVAGGATLALFTDLDKFRGTGSDYKVEWAKYGVGYGDGVLLGSFGPGTGGFIGKEFTSTGLLGLSYKPWGSRTGCSLLL